MTSIAQNEPQTTPIRGITHPIQPVRNQRRESETERIRLVAYSPISEAEGSNPFPEAAAKSHRAGAWEDFDSASSRSPALPRRLALRISPIDHPNARMRALNRLSAGEFEGDRARGDSDDPKAGDPTGDPRSGAESGDLGLGFRDDRISGGGGRRTRRKE